MRTKPFENYRKRVTNQINDEVDRATSRVAEALCRCSMQQKLRRCHPDEGGPLLNGFSSS